LPLVPCPCSLPLPPCLTFSLILCRYLLIVFRCWRGLYMGSDLLVSHRL
jgi:hypothetical protein